MKTKRSTQPLLATSILAALVILTGCGGSSSTTTEPAASQVSSRTTTTNSPAGSSTPASTPTPKTQSIKKENIPRVEKVEISSPALTSQTLPATYTCDGSDKSPPLKISGIPHGTAELMLDVLNIEPVEGKLYIDWAVAGISPTQHTITTGKVPTGAVLGTSSTGHTAYTLCPPSGEPTHYVAVLFALPHHLGAKNGFNASTLRIQALQQAKYEGFMPFDYTRK